MKVSVVALREKVVMEKTARRAREAIRMVRWEAWDGGMVGGEERLRWEGLEIVCFACWFNLDETAGRGEDRKECGRCKEKGQVEW